MKKYHLLNLLLVFFLLPLGACDKDENLFFSIEDDKKLGEQVSQEIEADPKIKILSETQYPAAYGHLRRITNTILNSGQVKHKDDFVWQTKIIYDDKTLNAFCTPGGYIYVYTGLIKYLDTEDQLAGVMGHEIAHADKRHTTDQLTKQYGISLLLDVVLGTDRSKIVDVAAGMLSLRFSRDHEREADTHSVIYLCPTEYQSNGAAGFFEKMINEGQGGSVPEFLSTHPNPDNRVQAINNEATTRGCKTTASTRNYQAFKNSLP